MFSSGVLKKPGSSVCTDTPNGRSSMLGENYFEKKSASNQPKHVDVALRRVLAHHIRTGHRKRHASAHRRNGYYATLATLDKALEFLRCMNNTVEINA